MLKPGIEVAEVVDSRGSRFLLKCDEVYYAVDRSVAGIVRSLQEDGGGPRSRQRIYAEYGVAAVDLDQYVLEHFPASWRVGTPTAKTRSPLLFQFRILSGRPLQVMARGLGWLFHPAVAALAGVLSLLACGWSFARFRPDHWGIALHRPHEAWYLLGLVVLGILVHELGHASALVRFGGTSRGIGLGIYWGFPTFFADVTGAWVLPDRRKVVVDIAGLYFQLLYLGIVSAAGVAMGATLALGVVMATVPLMMHTLIPALKFDGYWVLNDFFGLNNLHRDIRDRLVLLLRRAAGKPGRAVSIVEVGGVAAFAGLCVYQFYFMASNAWSGLARFANLRGIGSMQAGELVVNGAMLLLFTAVSIMLAKRAATSVSQVVSGVRHGC
jgi:putative peptide zinc metalloprotease protein